MVEAVALKGLDLVRGLSETDLPTIVTEAHSGWSKGWLAQITLSAPGSRFDLDRDFVNADASALSRSGNGNKTYKLAYLSDGVYEADSVYRSMQSFRTYFRVQNHSVSEIFESKNAAKAYLQNA